MIIQNLISINLFTQHKFSFLKNVCTMCMHFCAPFPWSVVWNFVLIFASNFPFLLYLFWKFIFVIHFYWRSAWQNLEKHEFHTSTELQLVFWLESMKLYKFAFKNKPNWRKHLFPTPWKTHTVYKRFGVQILYFVWFLWWSELWPFL